MRPALTSLSLLSVVGLAAAFAVSCGDECSRPRDCAADEVCYLGACTPRPGIACQSDADCGAGDGSASLFRCISGRCQGSDVFPDFGVAPDLGMADTGTSTIPDAGTSTTGDAG